MIEQLILGVVANGVWAVIAPYLGRAKQSLEGQFDLASHLEADPTLSASLERARDSVVMAKLYEVKVKEFLESPEALAFVRRLFATELIANGSAEAQGRDEFIELLSSRLGQPSSKVMTMAGPLYDAFVAACSRSLALLIDQGVLSAHESMSAARHNILLDAIKGSEARLVAANEGPKPSLPRILEFEVTFRNQVAQRHSYIIPPHNDRAQKVPINELYVTPAFAPAGARSEGEVSLSTEDLLATAYRLVILGSPGGGKSTFAGKLCFDLASRYGAALLGNRPLTPILVVLREYGAARKDGLSITEFIEVEAKRKYQVPEVPPGAFAYLLRSERVCVLFDGLDELLAPAERREISADVESFANLYPGVPMVVTSREVGYEQAPLDRDRFETVRLSHFDEEQVTDYARKWFLTDESIELTEDDRLKRADRFVAESGIVPDLRSNPLMLALMCNIYRGENYIPRNRPDVYRKCAQMLFRRWDKQREIAVELPFEAHLDSAMQHLAHLIYGKEAREAGVTKEWLTEETTAYLLDKLFEQEEDAASAAEQFIEFCRGRAWVFTDVGTTPTGEDIYRFTHRTFLEFFAASYLVRTHPTPEQLAALLVPHIAAREWDVVSELSFQIQADQVDDAADALLAAVVTAASEAEAAQEQGNLLAFAARCLGFIVPRPKVTRLVVAECIRYALAAGEDDGEDVSNAERGQEMISHLLGVAAENLSYVQDTLRSVVIEAIHGASWRRAGVAIELGLNLRLAARVPRLIAPQRAAVWAHVEEDIADAAGDRWEELSGDDLRVAVEALWRGRCGATQLVEAHGLEGLFAPVRYRAYPGTFSVSAAEQLVGRWIGTFRRDGVDEGDGFVQKQLELVGSHLARTAPPWITVHPPDESGGPWPFWTWREAGRVEASVLQRQPKALFGALLITCVCFEALAANQFSVPIPSDSESGSTLLQLFGNTVQSRMTPGSESAIEQELSNAGFSERQKNLIWKWVKSELSFTAHPGVAAADGDEPSAVEPKKRNRG